MAELRLWLGSLFEGLLCSPCPNAFKKLKFASVWSNHQSKNIKIFIWENFSLGDIFVKKTNNTIKSNKCNQCDYASFHAGHLQEQWGKAKQMQPVWLYILLCMRSEDTFENTRWRKIQYMQPVRLYILVCKRFENTFENKQWGKVKQMQPVWICINPSRQFEDTFVKT